VTTPGIANGASLPFLPTAIYPALPLVGLSEDEARVANSLAMRLFNIRPLLELRGLYYDGLQKMTDLGISIPPSLAGLRTVMGWPQIGVDAVDERCIVEGFRYPDESDSDSDLLDIWLANKMPLEHGLAQLDALIYGRSYGIVGPGDDPQMPLITVESPLNMAAVFDARLRAVSAAVQIYLNTDFSSDLFGREVAALYLPGKTIHMTRAATSSSTVGQWEITERDDHGVTDDAGNPIVPVVRIANRQRVANREGSSEITPSWMNLTDSACRTLLGMEVGREFHAAPRRYVLGASEENFRKADGTPVSAWDTYMGKIWGLERDEEGNLPQVGTFAPSDPSVYTKLLDAYRLDAAATMGLPGHYLGVSADGNPASADAIRASEARLIKRAERKMTGFGQDWGDLLRMALLIRDGRLPDNAHRIECDWADAATPTPGATTDALVKQIAAGMVSPTSDVVLKRAGYSALERIRLAIDAKNDAGTQMLAQLAHSLVAKDAKVDNSITKEINGPSTATTTPAPAASTASMKPSSDQPATA
jgi:hypothetical protein